MKNDREKDSLSLLLNETKEQGRSIFTLHQMLQPKSKDVFDWDDDKAYIIILSSLIYNSSKVVRILESTDYNLDSIVEILLTFSEVLDELDMKQNIKMSKHKYFH
ncbi:hypothetical protein Avbf_17085 [Armadillidium vulgare]|nr:hypothetical protein Avbf_17085 [Armadillidium vulgare]